MDIIGDDFEEGDFSFIINHHIRETLTFDYNYFKKNGWNLLKTDKTKSKLFWEMMKLVCHPYHTNLSYQNNLFYLEYISLYGWKSFILKLNYMGIKINEFKIMCMYDSIIEQTWEMINIKSKINNVNNVIELVDIKYIENIIWE